MHCDFFSFNSKLYRVYHSGTHSCEASSLDFQPREETVAVMLQNPNLTASQINKLVGEHQIFRYINGEIGMSEVLLSSREVCNGSKITNMKRKVRIFLILL